ncbi:MAG: hypothetical protein R3C53_21500 [Pirellulaceae bacterium]
MSTVTFASPIATTSSTETAAPTDSTKAWLWAFAITPIIALLSVCIILNVFNRDLNIPFEYGHDAFLVTVPIKTMVEEGWWYETPHLGAPHKMEFYDYPSSPNLHLAIIKVMSLFDGNPFRLVNYYFLLSFPLIAVCALAAFKSCGFRVWPSLALALVFSLSPYHFWRGISHLWLGVYFTVPLAMIVIVWIVFDRPGLLVDGERGGWKVRLRSKRSLAAIAICAALGFDFPYYPIFAAFLLMVVGPFTAYRLNSWRPMVRACVLTGLIASFFVCNLLPNLLYRLEHGKNMSNTLATIRPWNHAEMFGLKIAAMILPAEQHPIRSFDQVREEYLAGTVAVSSGSSAALGTIATVGFIALIGWLLIRQNRGQRHFDSLVDSMSVMNIAAILLATVGGFSAVANLLSVGVLRGYDRISIFVMFFALVPVAAWMCQLQVWAAGSRGRQIGLSGALLVVTVWGVFEQSRYCRMPNEQVVAEFHSDRDFVERVAHDAGPTGKVFQFPVQNFLSQVGPAIRWDPDTHFRGIAHTSTLSWSYGAVEGREASQHQNWIDRLPFKEKLESLALMDFGGIYIDRKLYDDQGASIEKDAAEFLESQPIVSEDARLAYFSLKDLQQRLTAKYSPDEFQSRRDAALHPLMLAWQSLDAEEVYPDTRFQWCQTGTARLSLNNLDSQSKQITVQFEVATSTDEFANLQVRGLQTEQDVQIGPIPLPLEFTLNVPPGKHYLDLFSDAKPLITSARNVTFRVCNFEYQSSEVQQVATRSETQTGKSR